MGWQDWLNRRKVIAGIDTQVESSRYLSLYFLELGRQGSYMMSDARLTYETETGNLAVTAFVNNLQNELVFSISLQRPAKAGVIYNQLRPPSTYGVCGTVRF